MLLDKEYTKLEPGEKISLAEAKLIVKDVTSDTYEREFLIPYESEKVDDAQVLRDLRKEIHEEIEEETYVTYFDGEIMTDKIVKVKLRRNGEHFQEDEKQDRDKILQEVKDRLDTLKDSKDVASHEVGDLDGSVGGGIYELSRIQYLIEDDLI